MEIENNDSGNALHKRTHPSLRFAIFRQKYRHVHIYYMYVGTVCNLPVYVRVRMSFLCASDATVFCAVVYVTCMHVLGCYNLCLPLAIQSKASKTSLKRMLDMCEWGEGRVNVVVVVGRGRVREIGHDRILLYIHIFATATLCIVCLYIQYVGISVCLRVCVYEKATLVLYMSICVCIWGNKSIQ